MPPGSAQAVVDEATVVIPLAGIIDLEAERARLDKDRTKALGEAQKVQRKLENADFVRRAPPEVVEESRERLHSFEQEAARLEAAIARIAPVPA
jgi:valyl-tRNA synthetase